MLNHFFHHLSCWRRHIRTFTIGSTILLISACASNGGVDNNAHNPSTFNHSASPMSHSNDIWQRVRDQLAMPDLYNDAVTQKEAYYTARADYVNRMTDRSGDFMYLIMNEIEQRHMPSEIALLPFVESAFVTTANSPVKASGLWQFMPETGRDFSLQQNRFADQRNDVIASTDAALTFLQRLHDQFGDWHLALAAYNWGPGNVTKAVRRAQTAGLAGTYEDIKMPQETREYVPKLQAIKNIIKNPAQYGITLPVIPNDARHEAVLVTRDIDVKTAAELAGMDIDSFKRLNPSFKKPVIAAALGSRLLVPSSRADDMRNAFNDRSRTLATLTTYSTYSTVTLADIASQFNTDEGTLRAINHIPSYHSYVKAGSTLLVPRTTNKSTQDIPYQALNEGLTTTSGDVGFGSDFAIEQPVQLASSDDKTREARSGITNTLFANNSPTSTGPSLSLANNNNDDLSQIIANAKTRDPMPVSGALVYNAPYVPNMPISNSNTVVAPIAPTTYIASTSPLNQVARTDSTLSTQAPPTDTASTSPINQVVHTDSTQITQAESTAPTTTASSPTPTNASSNDVLTPLDPSAFKTADNETPAAVKTPPPAKVAIKTSTPVVTATTTTKTTKITNNIVNGRVIRTAYTAPVITTPKVQKMAPTPATKSTPAGKQTTDKTPNSKLTPSKTTSTVNSAKPISNKGNNNPTATKDKKGDLPSKTTATPLKPKTIVIAPTKTNVVTPVKTTKATPITASKSALTPPKEQPTKKSKESVDSSKAEPKASSRSTPSKGKPTTLTEAEKKALLLKKKKP